jgi:HPt (histidine-containing phosphotransfer) domain-containing protein
MSYRNIPIIALTANAALEDVEEVLKNGMSDIVLKPIDPISLYATLKKWIKKNEPLAIKESKEKQISQSIFPSILKGINMKDGLRRFGGDQQHYKKILLKFLDDQTGIVEKINEAIENGDKNNAKILTHTLKGVAGNIGAEQVYMDVEQFESSILNDDKSTQKKLLAQLGKSLQQVICTIQNLKTDLPAFPQQKLNGVMVIDQSEISVLLSDLMIALQNGDTASFAIIEKFANQMEQKDPEINIYLESIQNLINEYDFDGALSEVVLLAKKLDIEIKQGP